MHSYSLDLTRLRAAYDSRELKPSRVVRDVLGRIAACNEANPAWIHVVAAEKLLARAADIERRAAAGERMPLYGVPFAVKDNIDVAGEPTTAACPAYRYIAPESAFAVQRLEAAGAICIGKTNMDQFATGLTGTRSPFGACRNPFDAAYVSGGSSSGSAVAVALGHVSFALGTDTAGSGRVPAGFCNLVGLKPTRGVVSTHGVVPACRSLDCVSAFALTVDDACEVLGAIAAFDPRDPYSRKRLTGSRKSPMSPLRCGVPARGQLEFFGDTKARASYESALGTLRSLGAQVVEIDYAPFAEVARMLYEGPWVAERLAAIRPFFESSAAEIHPVVRAIIASGARYTASDVFEAEYRLQALQARCEKAWGRVDALVVPTAPTIYRVDEVLADPVRRNTDLGCYTNFVNLLDLCALAVPGEFRSDGLPSGITFIAPAFGETLLADWGRRFHGAVASTLGATGIEPAASRPQVDEPRRRRHQFS